MLINFNEISEIEAIPMHGGTETMSTRMYADDDRRAIPCRLHKGGSIGMHTQFSGDDLNYILSGTGKAICDGKEEILSAGCCHICPKGSEHTIINTGDDDLVMFTIVVNK